MVKWVRGAVSLQVTIPVLNDLHEKGNAVLLQSDVKQSSQRIMAQATYRIMPISRKSNCVCFQWF